MANNIVTATFNASHFAVTPSIYRYNYGNILVFEGIENLPAYFEVHFANRGDKTTTPWLGQDGQVEIPNDYLQTGKQIVAYIYLHETAADGETVYKVLIPVRDREEPEDVQPTPEQQSALDAAIEALNEAIDATHNIPAGGTQGKVLAKASDDDYDVTWVSQSGGGGGGTSDYTDLTNKPQIEGVTLTGNKTASELGLAKATDIPSVPVQSVNSKTGEVVLSASDVGAYVKPNDGIPKTDLAASVQASLDKADTALQSAPVISVNNKTGAVVLSASDVGALPSGTAIPTKTSDLTNDSGFVDASGAAAAAPVQSVNNKTGAVVLNAADVGAGTYSKPSGGIPASDLASAVQTSLGKADSALQSVPSTYRTAEDQDVIDAQKVNTSDYNPDSKTAGMTQPVGKDSNGKLWTAPGGGGGSSETWELINDFTPTEDVNLIFINTDSDGNEFSLKKCLVLLDFQSSNTTANNQKMSMGFSKSGGGSYIDMTNCKDINVANVQHAWAWCEMDGVFKCIKWGHPNADSAGGYVNYSDGKDVSSYVIDNGTITSFAIRINTSTITFDHTKTRIRIYGVRA